MTFQSIYFIRFLNNLHEKSVGKQPNAECLWLFHSCTERELCGYSGDPRKVRARESESSLQTETAAAWAGETRRALKSNENLDRNERCLSIELSTLGTYSFSRQSSNSDESFPIATLLEQKRDSRALKSEKPWKNGLFSFCPSIQPSGRPPVSICRLE